MGTKQDKKGMIIEAALRVLKEVGSEGLTMRRVATEGGISLGNLQYHFKDKSRLLAGLGRSYFGECARMLDDYQHAPGSPEMQLRHLILFFLDHLDQISDMCRIFRELWAVSTRDQDLHDQLTAYYQSLGEQLNDKLVPIYADPGVREKVVVLLLPYFEGYSITRPALPFEKEAVADLLSGLCRGLSA